MFLPLFVKATSEALDTERADAPTLWPGLSICRLWDIMLVSFSTLGVYILIYSPVSDLRSPKVFFVVSWWIDLSLVSVWFLMLYMELFNSSDEAASL